MREKFNNLRKRNSGYGAIASGLLSVGSMPIIAYDGPVQAESSGRSEVVTT